LVNKIEAIDDDTELNNYLLDFVSILNEFSKDTAFQDTSQKGVMDSFVNASINTTRTELYNEYIKKFNPELRNINVNKTNLKSK
jgi:hypothetical protein